MSAFDHHARVDDRGERRELAGGVEAGWQPLLAELDVCLQAIDPGYYVEQVKEKLGVLRVYVVSLGGSERSARCPMRSPGSSSARPLSARTADSRAPGEM
jgi:hypothetical protein